MVDFNVTYYDWKNNGKLIDSLFTEKNIISKKLLEFIDLRVNKKLK